MAVEAWNERWHSVVVGVLAKRGWQLVQDAKAFAEAICLEVQMRSLVADQQRVAIERATIRHYCIILHAACCEQASQRQRRAFVELWEYLYPIAYYRTHDEELAKDLAQQALEKVWRNISKCREPGSFLSWATLILINDIRGNYRSKKRREETLGESNRVDPEISESDLRRFDEAEEDVESDALGSTPGDEGLNQVMQEQSDQELRALITRCIKSRLQQRILIESLLNDKGYKEIAEELDITIGNLHVLRHRALIALRKCDDFLRFVEDELK